MSFVWQRNSREGSSARVITYVTVFERQWDMTLGKMAMRIEVSDDASQRRACGTLAVDLPQARCSTRLAAVLRAQHVRQYRQRHRLDSD
jgi:hypothetical protein